MTYTQQLNEVLNSPAYSDKLKAALRSFDSRDCVKALRDAEALAALCKLKVLEVEQANNPSRLTQILNK